MVLSRIFVQVALTLSRIYRIYEHRFVRSQIVLIHSISVPVAFTSKSHLSKDVVHLEPFFNHTLFILTFLTISIMALFSMNLCLNVFVLFLIFNTINAAVNCTTQHNLLWNQTLPVNAYAWEFGTVLLSSDGATVFATAYGQTLNGDTTGYSYLVGTSTNGSTVPMVYSTQSSDDVNSSPVFVNSTTVAWTPYAGGSGKFLFTLLFLVFLLTFLYFLYLFYRLWINCINKY